MDGIPFPVDASRVKVRFVKESGESVESTWEMVRVEVRKVIERVIICRIPIQGS